MTARERIDNFVDEGTFRETGMFMTHRTTDFGMDTADAPSNCDDISELIVAAIRRLGLPPQRVCLIGPSKGATGAAIHGLRLHLPFIAVDPIVDDTFYRE